MDGWVRCLEVRLLGSIPVLCLRFLHQPLIGLGGKRDGYSLECLRARPDPGGLGDL